MERELFLRYEKNPIIKADDIPYPINSVFNAGATVFGDEVLLLLRIEGRDGISHLLVAKSKDGITDWKIDEKPTLLPDEKRYPEETWGIEDPRITFLDDISKWAIAYTSYSMWGPCVSLALTDDFKSFQRLGIILPPDNKDAALFPKKFGGLWCILHRPHPSIETIGAHIWISYSFDLVHWGRHKMLINARGGAFWDSKKVGVCTPPILTKEGWLIVFHGVKETANGSIYRIGLALLDKKDPEKLIARSNSFVFSPKELYERVGDVGNVVFPCGSVVKDDEIFLYYGSSDTSISLARTKIDKLLYWLREDSPFWRKQ